MVVLSRYFKPYVLYILLAIALLFGQTSCDLAPPDLMPDTVNGGITAGDTPYIVEIEFRILGIALISAACIVTMGFLDARVAAEVSRGLRRDVFAAMESFPNAEVDHFSTSSLITRITNDITQIQMLIVVIIRMAFYAPIMAVGGTLHALAKDKFMSWIIALAVFLLFIVVPFMLNPVMLRFQLIQKLIDRLNLVVHESPEGMLVIRAFDTQRSEENRFDKVNQRLTQTNLFVSRIISGVMPVMMLIMNLTTVLVMQAGFNQVSGFYMEVGDMMVYMQYVIWIITAFFMMPMILIMIPRAIVSINRVAEVLATKPSITDKKHPITLSQPYKGVVEYCHVPFHYPSGNKDVLTDINFTTCPRQITAFIDATGSGKSTLVNLLLRFYDVTRGEIPIDGINIKDWPLRDLYRNLGFVSQKGILFSGTVRNNLAYGDEGTGEEQILKTAGIAQTMEFIESKPDLFDMLTVQDNGNVSGGQKRRLAIARALAKDVPINVFDNSSSALDSKIDARLRTALKEKTDNSIQFLVAWRISAVMGAGQVTVLDHRRVVGKEAHRELMKGYTVYHEITLSQLSEKELQ